MTRAHEVTVQPVRNRSHRPGSLNEYEFQAVCSCGWKSFTCGWAWSQGNPKDDAWEIGQRHAQSANRGAA